MRARTHKVGAEGGWDEAGPFSLKDKNMSRPESIENAIRMFASQAAVNLGSVAGGHYNYLRMQSEIEKRMRDLVSVVEIAYGKDKQCEVPSA